MDVKQQVHDTLWGCTNVPNRMPEHEIEDVINALVDLIDRIVEAHVESVPMSFDEAEAHGLDGTLRT